MDQTLATITAMCCQEELNYGVQMTLPQLHEQYNHSVEDTAVTEDCRTKMASWCYNVVDYCRFRRETVEIAMNCLDRYIATSAGQSTFLDRSIYQLAAMTCLYTAVKIHEPQAMDPQLVSNLSRGVYTPQQIEDMEFNILMALQWHVNPPTSLSYVRHFLELIPTSMLNESLRLTVYDLTKYQTELAVNEYDLINVAPSTIAYCSLMNALESLSTSTVCLNAESLQQLSLGFRLSIGGDEHTFINIQNNLYEIVMRQPSGTVLVLQPPCHYHSQNNNDMKQQCNSSVETSPRSISNVNQVS